MSGPFPTVTPLLKRGPFWLVARTSWNRLSTFPKVLASSVFSTSWNHQASRSAQILFHITYNDSSDYIVLSTNEYVLGLPEILERRSRSSWLCRSTSGASPILQSNGQYLPVRARWLEREFTNRNVRGSNPTSASRLPLSRLGQPGSIPVLVLPSSGMAATHRKGVTAERFIYILCSGPAGMFLRDLSSATVRSDIQCLSEHGGAVPQAKFPTICKEAAISSQYEFASDGGTFGRDSRRRFCLPQHGIQGVIKPVFDGVGATVSWGVDRHDKDIDQLAACDAPSQTLPNEPQRGDYQQVSSQARILPPGDLGRYQPLHIPPQQPLDHQGGVRWLKWLQRQFTDWKVRGSNPTSACRLPLSRVGQPGIIPSLVLPLGSMAIRHRKGATAERFTTFL
ncbi:hypothetical protein CSKR_108821 [Clonorchis sinensis]|uniref:Uncharacterized protein n=1 Tax=Clonorchis sinensis TaxID=79923 RepID=A0A3R7DAX7_CLOSI|nr:hypothetical protein CSKR_108821 [Clonorchis sinensis]